MFFQYLFYKFNGKNHTLKFTRVFCCAVKSFATYFSVCFKADRDPNGATFGVTASSNPTCG